MVYALQRSGQPRACLERSEELLNTARSQHYRWAEGQLGIERAICLDALGRKGLALESIHTALAMLGTAGYPVLRLRALGMAAAIENSSEHHRAAWALNTEGLKLFWSGSYPPIRAQQFYNSLSRAAADTGLVWVVVAFAREASRAAVLSANPTVVATARFWLGKDATLAGLSAEAHRELSAADLLFDKLPHTAATEYYRTECRIGLAELAVKDGRFAESEEYLRKARARLHEIDNSVMIGRYFGVASQLYQRSGNAGLAERAARSRVAVAELALQSLHDMKDRLMWSREMGDSYYALADFEWRRQLSGDTALAILEGYRGAAFRTHSGPPLKPDFASLEVAPPEPQVVGMGQFGKASSGQTLLVYAMLPGGLTAWVSANGGTWSTRIQVEPDKLRHLAAGFRDHCADRTFPQSGLRSEARQLYRILIEPVVGHLPETGPLLIDPEPAIAGIPFPALLSVSGEYFGNRHTVSLAPGAPYYRGLRAAAPILPESPVLVVGSPAAAGGSGGFRSALPDADREVRSAASHFRNSTILSGREATTAAIEREMARNFVFHFAGHSVANGVRVGLPLAPNQVGGGYEENVMSADSITPQLLANCRLAVFSACATEGLENSAAADPESLVFAFLRSGVPQVIATRWNIDSAATATFMAAFYEALTMGKAVDVALEAAAASIRTRAETSHPYYWAGFRLYGKIS
ncbi:conserved hypothetical protein [Candidatus Sulfopaludibacter sp. SbA3]|nr:conserved hypothetical protein [Candidatus Sulfopaludibacter sp. SbA3]